MKVCYLVDTSGYIIIIKSGSLKYKTNCCPRTELFFYKRRIYKIILIELQNSSTKLCSLFIHEQNEIDARIRTRFVS